MLKNVKNKGKIAGNVCSLFDNETAFLIQHRNILLTTYKSFVRPYLDYCDTIYYQPYNDCFKGKLEKVQHNALLVITDAGTSWELFYKEVVLEAPSERRWYQWLFSFIKSLEV